MIPNIAKNFFFGLFMLKKIQIDKRMLFCFTAIYKNKILRARNRIFFLNKIFSDYKLVKIEKY